MADATRRVPGGADGDFFVDTNCINCGVSRHYAPDTFGDDGAHAFVRRQPSSKAEILAAQMALLACPMAAIGTAQKHDLRRARESFPLALAQGVFVTGYNDRSSYGAHSYFIQGEDENWLVDAPRFTKDLVDKIAALGGLDYIFLTHRDDVAAAHEYAAHFGARRVIHAFEKDAQPGAEIVLKGSGDHDVGSARIIFTPGHTRGHMGAVVAGEVFICGGSFRLAPGVLVFLARANRVH